MRSKMANWMNQWAGMAGTAVMVFALSSACQDTTAKISLPASAKHSTALAAIVHSYVAEVRSGLPAGARVLESLYKSGSPPRDDLERVQKVLQRARDSVQDLRVAKSTFFALVD